MRFVLRSEHLVRAGAFFLAAWSGAGLARGERYERPADMPDFSHALTRFDLPDFSIKLPKGFRSTVPSESELVDGNAGRKLWLWGRVVREEGFFLDTQLSAFYHGTQCAGPQGRLSTERAAVKTRFLAGFQVACGLPRSHFTAAEDFAIGWIKVWANSRKTNARYTLELQTTEPPNEEHVREVVERILHSLVEPKEKWLPKEGRKKGEGVRWSWPWRRGGREPTSDKDEPVFLY